MADLERSLAALVDPPLGEPPRMDDLEHRARSRRIRRRVGAGGTVTVAVVALVAGLAALTEPAGRQTVQTASPAGSGIPGSVGGTAGATGVTSVKDLMIDGRTWSLFPSTHTDGRICLDVRVSQPVVGPVPARCFEPGAGRLQADVFSVDDREIVAGVVAKDLPDVVLTQPSGEGAISASGGHFYPVNFLFWVVPERVNTVTLAAGDQRMTLTVHGRESSVNELASPPIPSTTAAQNRPPTTVAPPSSTPSAPATTAAPGPDTPVSTVVTSPPTTIPPTSGSAKRVEVTPGATDLRRHVFESAFASGAQSVTVRFWDGVEPCSVLGRVDVVEGADTVTITLWTGIGPGAEAMSCIAIAQYKEVIVPLSAPLGSRTIVDGAA